MKYGIIILLVLILSGCDDFIGNKKDKNNDTVSKPIEIKQIDTSVEVYERYYQKYTLDGCEYIEVNGGTNSAWGTHKGNCKNSIHKTDK
jgi:protein involved in sex pheromone biosynthesis